MSVKTARTPVANQPSPKRTGKEGGRQISRESSLDFFVGISLVLQFNIPLHTFVLALPRCILPA